MLSEASKRLKSPSNWELGNISKVFVCFSSTLIRKNYKNILKIWKTNLQHVCPLRRGPVLNGLVNHFSLSLSARVSYIISRLRVGSLYTMWQIYSAAEPVPWRNCFYVLTLIQTLNKVLLNNRHATSVLCVCSNRWCVIIDPNIQPAQLRPNYALRWTWHPMIASQRLEKTVFTYGSTNCALYFGHGNTSSPLLFRWTRMFVAIPASINSKWA